MILLLELHRAWAWLVIVTNGLAGVWSLSAHWLPMLRTRALWWFTVLAEVTFFVQAALGVGFIVSEQLDPPRFHLFYGFVAIVTVGILYSYRSTSPWVKQHAYLVYGLGGLFLMGLALRAFVIVD